MRRYYTVLDKPANLNERKMFDEMVLPGERILRLSPCFEYIFFHGLTSDKSAPSAFTRKRTGTRSAVVTDTRLIV